MIRSIGEAATAAGNTKTIYNTFSAPISTVPIVTQKTVHRTKSKMLYMKTQKFVKFLANYLCMQVFSYK